MTQQLNHMVKRLSYMTQRLSHMTQRLNSCSQPSKNICVGDLLKGCNLQTILQPPAATQPRQQEMKTSGIRTAASEVEMLSPNPVQNPPGPLPANILLKVINPDQFIGFKLHFSSVLFLSPVSIQQVSSGLQTCPPSAQLGLDPLQEGSGWGMLQCQVLAPSGSV